MSRGKNALPFSKDQQDKLDEVKRALCMAIKRQIAIQPKIYPKGIVYLMGTNRARLSDVETLKVDKLTINQLFHYLIRLEPQFKFQLLFKYSETKPKYQDEVSSAAMMTAFNGQIELPRLTDKV